LVPRLHSSTSPGPVGRSCLKAAKPVRWQLPYDSESWIAPRPRQYFLSIGTTRGEGGKDVVRPALPSLDPARCQSRIDAARVEGRGTDPWKGERKAPPDA